MAYDGNLTQSQQESTPELYLFTSGSRVERITSYQRSLMFLGNKYLAKPIERGGFSYDAEFGSTTVKIKAILTDNFKRFLAAQPIEPTNVKIYRAISSDLTDYVVLFDGQVKSVTIGDNAVQADCESRSRYLNKRLPKYIHQAGCNHDVYDAACALVAEDWKVSGTVTLVSGNVVKSNAWSIYIDGYFTGGKIVYNDVDMRLIIDHVGDALTLQIPFGSEVSIGTALDAYPGCDGSPETCVTKFNNLLKFLGMPYIPSRNPVIWGFQ